MKTKNMNTVWERKESLSYKSIDLFLTRRSGTLRRAETPTDVPFEKRTEATRVKQHKNRN